MEVLKLIEEMEDLIEDSSSVPLSRKVMIDGEEALDIIQEIRIRLPDEVQQASWIASEKERILEEAEEKAERLMNETESRLAELIDEDGISLAAKEKADNIVKHAEDVAREIRLGALEYADDILMNTQEQMQETIRLINENREDLRG